VSDEHKLHFDDHANGSYAPAHLPEWRVVSLRLFYDVCALTADAVWVIVASRVRANVGQCRGAWPTRWRCLSFWIPSCHTAHTMHHHEARCSHTDSHRHATTSTHRRFCHECLCSLRQRTSLPYNSSVFLTQAPPPSDTLLTLGSHRTL
jgi:hypothetical protein